ncbi:MAG: DUF3482 domain-containing protein [Xanthomonadaceae bacterium]|nr:DUF3482 domain-containing protein [Xanthomonadaceae bacterium]
MTRKALPALDLAVVGHTNTGKTSLVRTLLHRRDFGDIRNRAGTTRQVASAPLVVDGQTLITLYDSPGLEDAPGVIDWLDRQPGTRHDGPERIHGLLTDPQARERFDHEVRVLDLMLNVDVALYVVDVREPVLEKYLDELAVLALCGRPLLVVLNFVASGYARESDWRDALARTGLHMVLPFDAVIRDPATERRLFEKLTSQLDDFAPTLEAWMEARADEEHSRLQAAVETIAEMLIDVAAAQRLAELDSEIDRARAVNALHRTVREREQACVDTLLDLYRFGREDYAEDDLPTSEGQWGEDLFDPDTLRHHGIRTSGHVGLGASAGAAVDVATGGLSLGAGTLIGAAVGAGVGLVRGFGGRFGDRLAGRVRLMVTESTLRLLAWRQLQLLAGLRQRGHASQAPLKAAERERWAEKKLPASLIRARRQPEWSALNPAAVPDSGRARAIVELGYALRQAVDEESARETAT